MIWGEEDAIISVDHAYGLRLACTLHVLPRLGHFPHVEDPNQVSAAILAFFTHRDHARQPNGLPYQSHSTAARGAERDAHRPRIAEPRR